MGEREDGGCPDVSVIVVSYNAQELLSACLQSVPGGFQGETFEVVVLDNASLDGSADAVRSEFPEVRLIEAKDNLGFAQGVNLAADGSAGEHLLLLNPDTVVQPGAISRLLQAAHDHPGHIVYGGRTVSPDNTPDLRSCWGLPSVWSVACFGLGLSTAFRGSRIFDPESLAWLGRDTTREVEAVSGSFLLIAKDDWIRLGGFDPRFFMYSEDLDLCLRAARAGGRPLFVAEATVTHVGGASSDDHASKTALVLAGRMTFIDKHWRPVPQALGRFLLRYGVLLRAGLARARGRRATARQRAWIGVWSQRRRWERGFAARQAEP